FSAYIHESSTVAARVPLTTILRRIPSLHSPPQSHDTITSHRRRSSSPNRVSSSRREPCPRSTSGLWGGPARMRLCFWIGGGMTWEHAGMAAAALRCAGKEARRRLCVGNLQVGAAGMMAAQGIRVLWMMNS
ncbi:hypothetical protein Drorol1_Dr00021844, partial [Drosera rotundifolia]